MQKYHYSGSVIAFGTIIDNNYDAYTTAVSKAKALSNFKYNYKKMTGKEPTFKIDLPGDISIVGTVQDKVKDGVQTKMDLNKLINNTKQKNMEETDVLLLDQTAIDCVNMTKICLTLSKVLKDANSAASAKEALYSKLSEEANDLLVCLDKLTRAGMIDTKEL